MRGPALRSPARRKPFAYGVLYEEYAQFAFKSPAPRLHPLRLGWQVRVESRGLPATTSYVGSKLHFSTNHPASGGHSGCPPIYGGAWQANPVYWLQN